MVDDCHSTGFVGKTWKRNTRALMDVMGRVDIITSTLGKALVVQWVDLLLAVRKLLICSDRDLVRIYFLIL